MPTFIIKTTDGKVIRANGYDDNVDAYHDAQKNGLDVSEVLSPQEYLAQTQEEGSPANMASQIKLAQYEAQPSLNPELTEHENPLVSAARGFAKAIVPHGYAAAMGGKDEKEATTAGLYDLPNFALNALLGAGGGSEIAAIQKILGATGIAAASDALAQKSATGNIDPKELGLTALGTAAPMALSDLYSTFAPSIAKETMYSRYLPSKLQMKNPNAPDPELFGRMLDEGLQPYFGGFSGGANKLREVVDAIESAKQAEMAKSTTRFDYDELADIAKEKVRDSGTIDKDRYQEVDDAIDKVIAGYKQQTTPTVNHSVYHLDEDGNEIVDLPESESFQTNLSDLMASRRMKQDEAKDFSADATSNKKEVARAISRAQNDLAEKYEPTYRDLTKTQAPYMSLLEAAENRAGVGGSNSPLSLKDIVALGLGIPAYLATKTITSPGGAAMLYDAAKVAPTLGSTLSQGLKYPSLSDIYGTGTDYPANQVGP